MSGGGPPYKVVVDSDPPGAEIKMFQRPAQASEPPVLIATKRAPAEFKYDTRKLPQYFTCEATGHKTGEVQPLAKLNNWFWPTCILLFPIGPAVDGLTGATMILEDGNDKLTCKMEKGQAIPSKPKN